MDKMYNEELTKKDINKIILNEDAKLEVLDISDNKGLSLKKYIKLKKNTTLG